MRGNEKIVMNSDNMFALGIDFSDCKRAELLEAIEVL